MKNKKEQSSKQTPNEEDEFLVKQETKDFVAKQESKKPKVKLSGQNGNVFNLVGLCAGALKKAGQQENARKMTAECFTSTSYDEALQVMMKYCNVV